MLGRVKYPTDTHSSSSSTELTRQILARCRENWFMLPSKVRDLSIPIIITITLEQFGGFSFTPHPSFQVYMFSAPNTLSPLSSI